MRHLPQGWMKIGAQTGFRFSSGGSLFGTISVSQSCAAFRGFTVEKYRKLIFDKYHILLYQVKDQVVYVEYVIDGRQDYQWLLTP